MALRMPDNSQYSPGRKSGAGVGQKVGAGLGAVIGGFMGAGAGPAGIAAGAVKGAATGAGMGALAGEMIQPGREASGYKAENLSIGDDSSTAVTRRMNEIQQAPLPQLVEAKVALQQLPLDMQKEYAPVLDQAIKAAQTPRMRGYA